MYSSGYNVQTPESGRNPRGKKRKNLDNNVEEILCSVCDIWVLGVPQYQAHVKGSKHLRKTKERSADEVINRMPFMKWDKETGIYKCELCDVMLNSSLVAMMHVRGFRHEGNVEAYEAARGEILTYGRDDDYKISSSTSRSDNIPLSSSGFYNPTNSSNNGTSLKNEDSERKILEEVAKKLMPINLRDAAVASTIFECKVCDIRTNSEVQLEQHMESSKHNNRLLAVKPAEALPSKNGEKVQQFQCRTCNTQFNSQIQLVQHMASEHKNNLAAPPAPSAAKPADTPLPSLVKLKVQEFQCKTCNKQVYSQIQLDQHMASEHNNNLPENCVTSGPTLKHSGENTTLLQPKQHNPTSSSNNDTSLKDEDRERQILEEVAKKLMPINLRSAAVGLSTFECKVCDILTNSKLQLEQHMVSLKHKNRLAAKPTETLPSKTGEKVQQYRCKTCNIQVNSQIQLDQHMSSKHENKLPAPAKALLSKTEEKFQQFQCKTCNIQVNSQIQLDQHMTSKHKNNLLFPPAMFTSRLESPSASRYTSSAPRYTTFSATRYTTSSAPRYTPYPLGRP